MKVIEDIEDGKPCRLCQECTERLLNAYEFICSVEKAELDIENYLRAEKDQFDRLSPLKEGEEEVKEETIESTEIDVQDIEILDDEFQTEQEQLVVDEIIVPEEALPAEIQQEPVVEEFDSNT